NGSLVKPTRNGLVLFIDAVIETISNLASDLASQINAITGWLAHANVTSAQMSDSAGYHETALAGSVLVMSPPNIRWSPTISKVSAGGTLGARLIDQNYGGVAGTAARAAFTLGVGTTGTVTVTAPANADGTGTAQLSGGAITFNTS